MQLQISALRQLSYFHMQLRLHSFPLICFGMHLQVSRNEELFISTAAVLELFTIDFA